MLKLIKQLTFKKIIKFIILPVLLLGVIIFLIFNRDKPEFSKIPVKGKKKIPIVAQTNPKETDVPNEEIAKILDVKLAEIEKDLNSI